MEDCIDEDKKIDSIGITFDNDNYITYEHDRYGSECNYADFEQIDDIAKQFEFDKNLKFIDVDNGFRFGNNDQNMVFVPCYSVQNGYYNSDVEIYYNDNKVLFTFGEMKIY